MICNLQRIIDLKNAESQGKRMSQAAIAKETGIAVTTINRLYNNKFNRVDTGTVEKLCAYLACEIGELFILKEI
ncbi:helix-turn-helix transcriptional regulator [Anabaena minutissima FACHB-250]|nr:helix-turn-helix transcriptional regulator [Anabaena minutissima FACHB-250]